MFEVKDNIFYIHRGNKGIATFDIEGYQFKKDDIVEFKVYDKKGLREQPILHKKIKVEKACNEIDIEFTAEETSKFSVCNYIKEYWYEIDLNNDQTIIGYDFKGNPGLFYVLPRGCDSIV